jgi:hypothetical protein
MSDTATHAPTHGFTRLGHPVHAKTTDHLPSDTAYARFNKKVAVAITDKVGTMSCAWVFSVIALLSLPATLAAFSAFSSVFPKVLVNTHLIALIAWIAQTFIQLVLLSVIMVGQNIQSAAADARSAKTFEDTEYVKDQVNTHTDGGLKMVLDKLEEIRVQIAKP